jgi:hypothetical protein
MRGRYTVAWLGAAALATLNGAAREALLRRRLEEEAAQKVSTASLLAILTVYTRSLEARWPIPTAREAAQIGAVWVTLTLAFEFGLGRFVEHREWSEMLADYDLAHGKLWPLVPLWMAVAPSVLRARHLPRSEMRS